MDSNGPMQHSLLKDMRGYLYGQVSDFSSGYNCFKDDSGQTGLAYIEQAKIKDFIATIVNSICPSTSPAIKASDQLYTKFEDPPTVVKNLVKSMIKNKVLIRFLKNGSREVYKNEPGSITQKMFYCDLDPVKQLQNLCRIENQHNKSYNFNTIEFLESKNISADIAKYCSFLTGYLKGTLVQEKINNASDLNEAIYWCAIGDTIDSYVDYLKDMNNTNPTMTKFTASNTTTYAYHFMRYIYILFTNIDYFFNLAYETCGQMEFHSVVLQETVKALKWR